MTHYCHHCGRELPPGEEGECLECNAAWSVNDHQARRAMLANPELVARNCKAEDDHLAWRMTYARPIPRDEFGEGCPYCGRTVCRGGHADCESQIRELRRRM